MSEHESRLEMEDPTAEDVSTMEGRQRILSDPTGTIPPEEHDHHAEEEASLDEHEMRRHFMDVESSFLPEAAPPQQENRTGLDDTYLELGKPEHTSPSQQSLLRSSEWFSNHRASQQSMTFEAGALDQRERGSDIDSGDANPNLSSPAQAAATRGHARSVSAASAMKRTLANSRQNATGPKDPRKSSRPNTPGSQRPMSSGSTIRPESSPRHLDMGPFQPANAVLSSRTSRAPSTSSVLNNRHNRQLSRRSLTSSNTLSTDDSGNDDVLDKEFSRTLLQRLPSFGSSASYTDKEGNNKPFLNRAISGASVLANTKGDESYVQDDDNRPQTPPAYLGYADAPTDTIIAQHVQSIQVPETIARDFRARNRSLSPNKQRPTSSGQGMGTFQSQTRRTLTLKEQNSKIDKLTKENFDLKLKIHFLDQALQSRSEDGVKDLIHRNVQFQTDLTNERKETQNLRRKMRELERKIKEQEASLAENERQRQEAQRSSDSQAGDDEPTLQAEMHEEILFLRQQLDHSENKVTTLTEEVMTKEFEKRKMTEHMRSMASNRGKDTVGLQETESMWQDLLETEQSRREQAEEDIRKLREEITVLRIERASPTMTKYVRGKRRNESETIDGVDYADGVASDHSATLIDQLRNENAELRRDLGAQTSMLTSRNRERERLQQEIEDLKLFQRKSDGARSVAGESIFERSISRAHHRAPSRASEAVTAVTETEREDWEKKEGQLRDQNAELRLKYQELERTHNTHLQYISTLEGDFQEMENELNECSDDLRALQAERDEALQAYDDKESEYGKLEQEALVEIERLEKRIESLSTQLDESHKRLQRTQAKLEHTSDGYRGLQGELKEITSSVLNLEDEKQANMRTIQTLEQQLSETEDELQKWEQKCKEMDQKNRKLEITQESLHSEITFLRDEQEGDKIKIGELEDELKAAQQRIQDEQEKLREMEEGIVEERQQRDVLENKSKEEVQKVLDDLNAESSKTKDELRKTRRELSAKEVESSGWKQKLDNLEQSLRHILGDPEGSKQSLLAEVEKLQRDLETTTTRLDRIKMDLADKDRLLRHRDGLLESTSLESRRLSDLLDKERASRKHELEQFEKASRGQATHMRTIAQQQTRMMELESAYIQDKRRMAELEEQYHEQLLDRNNLLLAVWNRLSTLCGADWAQDNSLVNGENPTVDAIARHLPAFNRNLIAALKTVETLIGSFKARIRDIEKSLGRNYKTLEHHLAIRVHRIESLERAVEDIQSAAVEEAIAATQRPQTSRTFSGKSSDEIGRLKADIKVLKAELKFYRQNPNAAAQQMLNQQQPNQLRRGSSAGSTSGKSQTSPARQFVSHLLRQHSTSSVEQVVEPNLKSQGSPPQSSSNQTIAFPASIAPIQPNEQRWNHRLKELQKLLKAEREGRLLDRQGARQRLEEGRLENEELRQMLEHERTRAADASSASMNDRGESEANSGSGVD